MQISTIKMSTPFLYLSTLSILLVIFSHYSFLHILATDTRLKFTCSKTSYTPNSQYEKNLNSLFESLKQNATHNVYRFYNTSVGHVSSDTVYGHFLCRGDDTVGDCRKCVANATDKIFDDCPGRPVSATIWFVDCMVRYSNESMSGTVNTYPSFNISDPENMTANIAANFMNLVGNTLQNSTDEAANSTMRYNTTEVPFNSFITVYTMAQCTPDLSPDQCRSCLTKAKNDLYGCCNNRKGARVLTPSCNIRYDINRFYQLGKVLPKTPVFNPDPLSPKDIPSVGFPANEIPKSAGKGKSTLMYVAAFVLVAILVVLVTISVYLVRRTGRGRSYNTEEGVGNHNRLIMSPSSIDYGDLVNAESLQYDWTVLRDATKKFSDENKLGEGGFGCVYKGALPNGQEIAVKRLSKDSNQGAEQFKNEVVFVAKLQHRNLVKLLGFCLAGYEKLLVYEYVSNQSLDLFLFDHERRSKFEWLTRYNIIKGVARGILYLHEDSRLRIIHRDLKASNILLDADMNPKISDFGMARNFVDETQANTSRIAGTFGYMAPEYLLHGEYSVKSDVYSFGVLVLEMVSGKRSTSFRQSKVAEHISTYIWNNWKEGNHSEITDPYLGNSYSSKEVQRCIQIGLLCTQGEAEMRPTMASVVFNLNSDSELPVPQEPTFFNGNRNGRTVTSSRPMQELGFAKSSSNSIQLSFGSDLSVN